MQSPPLAPPGGRSAAGEPAGSSRLPPEVARALGLHQQPAWQKYAPFGVFLAGAAFLFGGERDV